MLKRALATMAVLTAGGSGASATRETTGRYRYTASRMRSCSTGDQSCSMTRTGRFGGVATRTRAFNR